MLEQQEYGEMTSASPLKVKIISLTYALVHLSWFRSCKCVNVVVQAKCK